jgi:alkylation response protein AidB-like acyl-CoA dehydrogenase
MNLDLTPTEAAFRDEVRALLERELTPGMVLASRAASSVFLDPVDTLPWQRILNARGWAAPNWPQEHGGTGWTEMQKYIFASECDRAGAPALAPMGLKMVGPCIIRFGDDGQKRHLLPRILSGEDYWCQGYSEPGSGSDLASLKTRAETDGDDYIVTGSKIWTTHAHFANRIFCLVRTRSDGKPQAGITFLLMDMRAPGVTVRPIVSMSGDHELNEVFFDGVRVPRANRLGGENEGWMVAKHLLEFERGGSYAPGLRARLDRLRTALSEQGDADDSLMRRLCEAEILIQAIQTTEHRIASAAREGENPGPFSSMLKVQGTEAAQIIDELVLQSRGAFASAPAEDRRPPGSNAPPDTDVEGAVAAERYLNGRAATIYGGSNEVQRNILARAVLGL